MLLTSAQSIGGAGSGTAPAPAPGVTVLVPSPAPTTGPTAPTSPPPAPVPGPVRRRLAQLTADVPTVAPPPPLNPNAALSASVCRCSTPSFSYPQSRDRPADAAHAPICEGATWAPATLPGQTLYSARRSDPACVPTAAIAGSRTECPSVRVSSLRLSTIIVLISASMQDIKLVFGIDDPLGQVVIGKYDSFAAAR